MSLRGADETVSSDIHTEERVVPGWLRSDCLSSLLYGGDGSDPGTLR